VNRELDKSDLFTMLVRGLFRRCARCGGKGAFYTGWIKKSDRCKTCGFKWERNLEGFQLGAAAMNIIMTGGSLLFVMAIGVVATYPEVPTWPLIAIVGSVALIVGIGGFPTSYTVWLAIDLRLRPPDEAEVADAAEHARS
jgi:uncharacterized protein (DUF983 family)